MAPGLEQLKYLDKCRKMLIGKTIRGLIYSQFNLDSDNPDEQIEPVYLSDDPGLDFLESFFYLKTDEQAYRFAWITSHIGDGVFISELDHAEIHNEDEYQWEVSGDPKWQPLIGETITDLQIIWEQSWSTHLLSNKPFDVIFPHSYILKTENGQFIVLAASIFDEGDIKPFVEGLWITTNLQLARERKLISD